MAASKRKIFEEDHERESGVEVEKKKKARMEDRLSDLPEALQLRILACLDARQAVQTSVLSKTWVSSWTRIPGLDFNYFTSDGLYVFDNFINRVLCSRDPLAKLEVLKYKVDGSCSTEMLKSVFDYAILHGVKHLEASIRRLDGNDSWPVSAPCDSSLTSLKLHNHCGLARCPFLGPKSIFFKNLTVLFLTGALITDVEPFSGFPVLESLTLLDCYFCIELGNSNKTVKVHALGLSHLNISNCMGLDCFELNTPSLRFLEYQGSNILKHEGLTVLETLKINFNGFGYYRGEEGERRLIDDMMSLFCTLPNVKSLTLFWATVLLLSFFPNELARRGSPFRELKDLTLDLSKTCRPRSFHKRGTGWFESVKAYLLQNSPHAKFTLTSPTNTEWLYDDLWSYDLLN